MERVKKIGFFMMTGASAAVIVLVIAAALVFNSGMVDHFARKQLIDLFNNEYRGHIELKEVGLRFPDQVTITAPCIFEEGSGIPAASADRVRLKFNFLSLLRPKITLLSFREVSVEGFRAAVVEYPDKQLNLGKIFTRKHPDKPEVLAIGKFRARHFTLNSDSISWKPANKPAYNLKNLELELSRVFVAKYEFMGTIKKMQFTMPDRGLTLRKGAGTLAFSSVRSDVIGLDIETTKSHAKLSVSMDGLDIFSGITRERLRKSGTFIHIESLSVDAADLNQLLPAPLMPPGVMLLQGDAKGTLNDLEILPSALTLDDSRLAFRGRMLNLLDKTNLSFNLQLDKSAISRKLLDEIVHEEPYRKLFKDTERLEFDGMLRGQLDRWMTNLNIRSALANGSTTFETTESGDERYQVNGSFILDKIEPHKLAGLDKFRSSFSGSGSFDCTFGPAALEHAHLESTVRSAYWQQQQISSGTLSFDLEGQKVDFSANLGSSDGTGIIMTGIIDFSQPILAYETGGNVRKLDIARITGSPEIKSDLNGSFDLKGDGTDIASLNLKGTMTLEPSTLNGFQFRERSTFTAGIIQSAGFTSVTLTNDAFELSLQGNTSMIRMMTTLQRSSVCILRTTGNRPAQQPPLQASSPASGSSSSFSYKANIRDLAPLRPFLSLKDLQFRGNASGQVTENGNQISINTEIECSTLSSGATFSMHNTTLKGAMICSAEDVLSATASCTSGSITMAGNEFRNLRLLSSFDKERLDTSLELAMPQLDNKLITAFHTRRNANLATITIDRFQFVGPQGIWQAASGSTIDIAADFTRFNRITLYKGNQSIELDGLLSSTLPGAFRSTFSNIDLAETKFALPYPKLKLINGLTNAQLTVSGTPGAKITELELKGTAIAYDEFRIGTVNLHAIHTGENLQFSVESKGTPTESGTVAKSPVNTVKGSGSIPMLLTFAPLRIQIPETQPLQASFHSDDLSSEIITSIVPIFDYAEGALPTDLRIAGTLPNPDIFLSITLDGTRIRIAPTRVTYLLKGHIVGTPSRIDLDSIDISDSQGGSGSISGMIALEGLKPVSVNLTGAFRNLLLYSKKDLKDDTSFGTISASTDNLRFHGALNAPTAEGELKLTSANFSLYRKGSNESAKYVGVDKYIRFVPRHPSTKPVETTKERPDSAPQFNYNLLDIIQIRNLRLSCNLPVRGTMIFDRIRGERIEATMNNLSLLVNKSEQRFSLYGSVDITGGKYLFSNSSFDLDNGGRINWNNEEIRNGHLNDIYGSKQVSAYNTQTGDRDNVKLLIAVSGTIDLPNVRMGYYLNNDSQPYSAVNMIGRQPSHIDPNADLNVISMLFSRQWYLNPERQATGGNNPVSVVGVSAGTGLLSSQVSGIVQDIAGLESFNVNLGTGTDGNLSGLELYFALLVPGTDGKIRFIGTGSTPVSRNSVTSNYDYGSSQKIEYRVNPRVYIEAFRSQGMTGGDAAYSNLQKPTENWGSSVSYREKFHTWSQLWDHLFGGNKKEKTGNK